MVTNSHLQLLFSLIMRSEQEHKKKENVSLKKENQKDIKILNH